MPKSNSVLSALIFLGKTLVNMLNCWDHVILDIPEVKCKPKRFQKDILVALFIIYADSQL